MLTGKVKVPKEGQTGSREQFLDENIIRDCQDKHDFVAINQQLSF